MDGNVPWASQPWRSSDGPQPDLRRGLLGFSYGFRPEGSQHDALDALWVGLMRKRVNWVLDADIRAGFDTLSHEWLIKFVEHRIADRRILRLIGKWLRAGLSEEGKWTKTEVGSPQGAIVSPLLANIYLHYVFDLWIEHWRKHHAAGDVIIVRYADDIVAGFVRICAGGAGQTGVPTATKDSYSLPPARSKGCAQSLHSNAVDAGMLE
jgi:hypothetical protein